MVEAGVTVMLVAGSNPSIASRKLLTYIKFGLRKTHTIAFNKLIYLIGWYPSWLRIGTIMVAAARRP